MGNRAVITGVNGQDGILLSSLLIQQGVDVVGLGTQQVSSKYLDCRVKYVNCDIRNTEEVLKICNQFDVDLFFNLAGISSVMRSFHEPELVKEINFEAPKRILNKYFSVNSESRRFFQASSSEMFGECPKEPQDEATPLNPLSPYAESKTEMHIECNLVRERGFYVASAIMYNHESIFRPQNYLSKKIVRSVAELYFFGQGQIHLGNLSAERDWGYAGDYMNAVSQMMQLDEPENLVLATGQCHSVIGMVTCALDSVGLRNKADGFVKTDKSLLRPKEANRLVGNPDLAEKLLGWRAEKSFQQLIAEMVQYEIEQLQESKSYN